MIAATVTPDTLNFLMDFDHVIRVNSDLTVDHNLSGIWAPELHDGALDPGYADDGWSLMTGYTGAYGYNGPIMNRAEFIGGRMARDILAAPGYYVALVDYPLGCEPDCQNAEHDDCESAEPDGWAVAYRPLEPGHDPECVTCEHDCPWRRPNHWGSPFCPICDDHHEASDDD